MALISKQITNWKYNDINRNYLLLILLIAIVIGIIRAQVSIDSRILTYTTIVFGLIVVMSLTYLNCQQLFCSATLLLTVLAIVFWLPGILRLWFLYPHPFIVLIKKETWEQALGLVLIGQASIILGWLYLAPFCPFRRLYKKISNSDSSAWVICSMIMFFIGVLSFIVYLIYNFGEGFISLFLSQGAFRGKHGIIGSGKYFIIGTIFMEIGIILLASHSLRLYKNPVIPLLGTIIVTLLLSILGGRANALRSILIVLLILFHNYYNIKPVSNIFIRILILIILCVLIIIYSFVIVHLRHGYGLQEVAKLMSLTNFVNHITYGIWLDYGHFHPIAMAIQLRQNGYLPPFDGLLNIFNLFGIFNKFGYKPSSVGEWITIEMGFAEPGTWGFGASLFGSSYLYGGIPGVILGGILFGILMNFGNILLHSQNATLSATGALIIIKGILLVLLREPLSISAIVNDLIVISMVNIIFVKILRKIGNRYKS